MIEVGTERYYTETELADLLDRTVRTLRNWRGRRIGPPVTFAGRTPLYRESSVNDWLASREHEQVREG